MEQATTHIHKPQNQTRSTKRRAREQLAKRGLGSASGATLGGCGQSIGLGGRAGHGARGARPSAVRPAADLEGENGFVAQLVSGVVGFVLISNMISFLRPFGFEMVSCGCVVPR